MRSGVWLRFLSSFPAVLLFVVSTSASAFTASVLDYRHVESGTTTVFSDDFEDGALDAGWLGTQGNVSESGGALHLSTVGGAPVVLDPPLSGNFSAALAPLSAAISGPGANVVFEATFAPNALGAGDSFGLITVVSDVLAGTTLDVLDLRLTRRTVAEAANLGGSAGLNLTFVHSPSGFGFPTLTNDLALAAMPTTPVTFRLEFSSATSDFLATVTADGGATTLAAFAPVPLNPGLPGTLTLLAPQVVAATIVPEPNAVLLIGLGLGALAHRRRAVGR